MNDNDREIRFIYRSFDGRPRCVWCHTFVVEKARKDAKR
jgi:hypothetical protein